MVKADVNYRMRAADSEVIPESRSPNGQQISEAKRVSKNADVAPPCRLPSLLHIKSRTVNW